MCDDVRVLNGVTVSMADLVPMFAKFRADDFLCDVVLTTRNGVLKAHSLVLAAASDVFKQVNIELDQLFVFSKS